MRLTILILLILNLILAIKRLINQIEFNKRMKEYYDKQKQ